MRYVKLKQAVKATGLHPNTLRKYADGGHIPSKRTPAGQRLFCIDQWLGVKPSTICYARVSSYKQQDDLQRQVDWLASRYPRCQIIRDIGSGLNFKRKGLKALLERSLSGEQLTVVVAHRDRLARFGVELIEWLVERNGGKIVVLGRTAKGSPLEELTQDLLAILSVFSSRMHGLRRYRDEIKANTNLSNLGAGGEASKMAGS